MKVLYKMPIFFFVLFCATNSFSQQNVRQQIDSLFKVYKTENDPSESLRALTLLGQRYRYVNVDSSKYYLKKAIAVHKQQEPSHYLFAFAYNVIADIHKKQKEIDSAKFYYEEAYTIFSKNDSKNFLLAIAPPYGQFLANNNEVTKGIEVFESAITIAEQNESYSNLSYLYLYLGNVFYEVQKDLEKAKKFYNDAKALSSRLEKSTSDRLLSFVFLKLAKLNFEEGNINASLENGLECVLYSEKANLPNQSVVSYNILSNAFLVQGKIQEAKKYNDLVMTLNSKDIDLIAFIESEIINQTISSKSGNLEKCIQKGHLILSTYNQYLTSENKHHIFKNLSQCYMVDANTINPAIAYRDSLIYYTQKTLNVNHQKSLAQLYDKQILKEEESKRKLLFLEKEISDSKLKNQRFLSIILFAFFLMSMALVLILYRSFVFKKKNNKILEKRVIERTKELELSNEKLYQSNYELRMLNYLASHDIKEPIRKIYDYLTFVKFKLPADIAFEHNDKFVLIEQNVEQLYTLIEDFTNYISLSNDRQLSKDIVDLNKIIATIDGSLLIMENKFKGFIISEKLPKITSNSSALFIILKNIIENGLKYNTSDNPEVKISARIKKDRIHIRISDNGIGIEEKYFEKIFELTNRLHNRTKYVGSGIGLSLVKMLINKLEGCIDLESEAGKGTVFTIVLPVND